MSTEYKVGSLLAYFGNNSAPFKDNDFEKDLNNHDKKVKRALSCWEQSVNDNFASPEKKKKKSGNAQGDEQECKTDYNKSTPFKRQKKKRNNSKYQDNYLQSKAEYKKFQPSRKRKKHGKDQDDGQEITECVVSSPVRKQKKKNSKNQDKGHENKIECKESTPSRKRKKIRDEDHGNEQDNKTECNNPPLSRKQKKHHKGNNSEQDSGTNNSLNLGRQPMDRKSNDDPEKLARTLFVGNLPPTMKSNKLIRLFKRFGKIQSVRFRSAFTVVGRNFKLEDKESNSNSKPERRFSAYVVMDNIESISSALQLNGSEIEGHIIRVDSAQNTNHDHKKSVFIANLPYSALEDEVRAFFRECGNILNVRIIRDPVHGAGKGIGYVLFDSEDGVMLALQKHGQDFNGRMLRVQPAKSEKTLKKNKKECVALTSTQWHSKKSKPHYYKNFSFGGLESEQGRKAKRKIIRQIRHPRISNRTKQSNQETADQW